MQVANDLLPTVVQAVDALAKEFWCLGSKEIDEVTLKVIEVSYCFLGMRYVTGSKKMSLMGVWSKLSDGWKITSHQSWFDPGKMKKEGGNNGIVGFCVF